MGVRFEWVTPEKKIIRYIVEGDWNWKLFHTCVRISLFAMHNHPHPVDTLIDLRGSTRPQMPAGLAAHARSFGKKHTPALSGRAVVIGLPAADLAALNLDAHNTLITPDGSVVFAEDEQAAYTIFIQ
jgi:hypothetical protein